MTRLGCLTSAIIVRQNDLLLVTVVVLRPHPTPRILPPGIHQAGLYTSGDELAEYLGVREELVEIPSNALNNELRTKTKLSFFP